MGYRAIPLANGVYGKKTSCHLTNEFVYGFCSGRPALIDYKATAAYAHPLPRYVIIAYEARGGWVQVRRSFI